MNNRIKKKNGAMAISRVTDRRTGPTLCLEKRAHDKNKQNTCCDARAAPFVSSPVSACSEASFGKPAPKKKQPSFLRLASQQGKP